MLKRFVAIGGIALSACGFLPGESKAMNDFNQDIIFIGCTVPSAGTGGMTVYSIEAVGADGKWIATELGKTKAGASDHIGNSCSGVINKLTGTGKGCMSGMNWVLMHQPTLDHISNAGYSLNLFSLMCDYSSTPPS